MLLPDLGQEARHRLAGSRAPPSPEKKEMLMKFASAAAITLSLSIIAPALAQRSPAITAKLDRSFAAMDLNKNGQIDRAEFDQFMMARYDKQAEALDLAFDAMDKDKNGSLSRTEAAANPVIGSVFDALDEDKNGALSRAEMRSALEKSQALEGDGQ
jgi:Ca2+-binding EF-hand superfamily protein